MRHPRRASLTAILLEHETGYRQQPGGPYRRARAGVSTWRHDPDWRPPSRPDGLAYDDDPHDTGGRTCMGLLQREYDPWRRAQGLPPRDVWLIEDAEVDALYAAQYWRPSLAADMPPGVDLVVYDSALLCGVGMAARFLQRALGVRDDGHVGVGTMTALAAADPADVVRRMIEARRTYHRKSRTFRHHGAGWLKRADALEEKALAMLAPSGAVAEWATEAPGTVETALPVLAWGEATVHEAAHFLDGASGADAAPAVDFSSGSRRDLAPPAAASMTETQTAARVVVTGAIGGGLSIAEGLSIYERVERSGLVAALLDRPLSLALIVGGVGLVVLARAGWLDRGRKLVLGV